MAPEGTPETAVPPDGFRIVDPRDPFEIRVGPFLLPPDAAEDPRLILSAGPEHRNGSGALHGGLLLAMADVVVCWGAVRDAPDERAITVSLTANFVAAGEPGGEVVARAELVRRTGSMAFVNGRIEAGGRVLLTCSAVVKRVRRG